MNTFYRIASLAVLFISFALIVSATSSPRADDTAWVITSTDAVSECLKKFFVEIHACINVIADCQDIAALKANILIFVGLCNKYAAELVVIGAGVKVTAEAQANIVACFAAFITLFVKVCLDLTVRFGLAVVVALCVEVDACLQILLKNLDICIKGVVALIAKACGDAVVSGFVQLKLKLCLAIFGKVGLGL
ncbi:hypothetical protein OPQ81_011924 [Rhizoctonia solani]|nr:hypothetical protein OPQ81_011924 [Rhizoctonia solani]